MFLVLPLLGLAPAAPDGAEAEARAVVEKAVAAHGGEVVLVRPVRYRSKGWQVLFSRAGRWDYDAETVERLPGDRKRVTRYSRGEQEFHLTALLSGGRSWVATDGRGRETSGFDAAGVRQGVHARHVRTLVPLLKGGYALSPLGEGLVNDAPTVGVRVAAAGYEDIDLHFDAETGLLAKVADRSVRPDDGRPVRYEAVYSDYRDWGGRKVAARSAWFMDGAPHSESEIYEYRVLDAVDDAEFDPAVVMSVGPNWVADGIALAILLALVWTVCRWRRKGAPRPEPGAAP